MPKPVLLHKAQIIDDILNYLVEVKSRGVSVEAHASRHEDGGADAINPANIGANWNKLVNKPSTFPPEAHDHSGDTLNPAVINVGDVYFKYGWRLFETDEGLYLEKDAKRFKIVLEEVR